MAGTLQASVGQVARNPKVRMATFSQHHMDGLDLALSPLQYMLHCFPGTKDQQQRSVPQFHNACPAFSAHKWRVQRVGDAAL